MGSNLYQLAWQSGMSYQEYVSFVEQRLAQGQSTGANGSEAFLNYSELGLHRMKRINKNLAPDRSNVMELKAAAGDIRLLILTEGWCGDAAQIVPVVEALASASGIESRYILRDRHLELMDKHLTRGGRAIPMVLILTLESMEPLGQFGPRPKELQQMVMDYKTKEEPKEPYEEFQKEVQLWYAKDKQQSIQDELTASVVSALNQKG